MLKIKTYSLKTKHKKILADTITPVSVYLKLRDVFPHSLLLESSDYHANKNDFSYICCNPIAYIELKNNRLTTQLPDNSSKVEKVDFQIDIPERIHQFSKYFESEISPFKFISNGIFGYISYDAVDRFENIELNKNDNVNIQWQILQPEINSSWQDLEESDFFKGVKTKSLVLIDPDERTVNWKFRAKIGSIVYQCGPLIFSNETNFDYQPLEIPNAFSPNNDGMNEKLEIRGLGKFPNHKLTIYSRWETVIISEAPYENDWGGEQRLGYPKKNGGNLPEGTYFYILDLGNGQSPIKGCLLYTSPSPRDLSTSRMPSSA